MSLFDRNIPVFQIMVFGMFCHVLWWISNNFPAFSYPEDEGIRFLQNAGIHPPNYMHITDDSNLDSNEVLDITANSLFLKACLPDSHLYVETYSAPVDIQILMNLPVYAWDKEKA
jgi:hypothetical protein